MDPGSPSSTKHSPGNSSAGKIRLESRSGPPRRRRTMQVVGRYRRCYLSQSPRADAPRGLCSASHRERRRRHAIDRLGRRSSVRTASANPLALAPILRREVSRARSELRVSNVRTQEEIDSSGQTVRERLLAMLALFFAGRGAAARGHRSVWRTRTIRCCNGIAKSESGWPSAHRVRTLRGCSPRRCFSW